MASVAARPNKPRKDNNSGPSNANRRGGGWRGSPGTHYSPNLNHARLPTPPQNSQGNFPPLSHPNPPSHDRWIVLLANFVGSSIIVTTRAGTRHEGILAPTEQETAGVLLKDCKDLANPNAPPKESSFFQWQQVSMWQPSEGNHPNGQAAPDTFRTDTDISASSNGRAPQRELHAWKPETSSPTASGAPPQFGKEGGGDDVTFGSTAQNGSWDQFSANEQLFGVTATFDEDIYTTKLDRSAPDFKERERKAARIASEIMGTTANNPHQAEERGHVDDSGVNEEDKYGAVVRGANAYVPPGARKVGQNGAPTASPAGKPDIPKVSINGPDGSAVPRSPPPPAANSSVSPKQSVTDNNLVGTFREFVTKEKQRLVQKKHDIVKNEMDKRIQDLKKFSVSFKLSKPIPEDLVPILTKDEGKQKSIIEKSVVDSQSASARAIGNSAPSAAALAPSPPTSTRLPPGSPISVKQPSTPGRKSTATAEAKTSPTVPPANTPAKSQAQKTEASRRPHMVIQAIPPFNRDKHLGASPTNNSQSLSQSSSTVPPASPTASVNSSTSNAFKLNVNASSFRPNPTAPAFKPGGAAPSSPATPMSPKQNAVTTPPPSNPFFGTTPVKKTAVNIKEDFNPFKASKIAEAAVVGPMWPYTGKRYFQTFPHVPHPPPMQAPPPPSYEEDSAAQAALRAGPYGMMYAYAPYQYPGQPPQQPMMAVQGSAPPAGYMPSPFMQPIPYPPPLPPNAPPSMYGPPQMANMPPSQAYLPPPPPGAYPPNGGPRGSMPPTPMPPHAYAYHQSPQLPHAVPYGMMMQQPAPGSQPHPYDNQGPPGPGAMGVGH